MRIWFGSCHLRNASTSLSRFLSLNICSLYIYNLHLRKASTSPSSACRTAAASCFVASSLSIYLHLYICIYGWATVFSHSPYIHLYICIYGWATVFSLSIYTPIYMHIWLGYCLLSLYIYIHLYTCIYGLATVT